MAINTYNYNNPQAKAYGTDFNKKIEGDQAYKDDPADIAANDDPEAPLYEEATYADGADEDFSYEPEGLPSVEEMMAEDSTDEESFVSIDEDFYAEDTPAETPMDPKEARELVKKLRGEIREKIKNLSKLIRDHDLDTQSLENYEKQIKEFRESLLKVKTLEAAGQLTEQISYTETEVQTYIDTTLKDVQQFTQKVENYLKETLEKASIPEAIKTEQTKELKKLIAEAELNPEKISDLENKFETITQKVAEAPTLPASYQNNSKLINTINELVKAIAPNSVEKQSELLKAIYGNEALLDEINFPSGTPGQATLDFLTQQDAELKRYLSDPAMKRNSSKDVGNIIARANARNRLAYLMKHIGFNVTTPEHGLNPGEEGTITGWLTVDSYDHWYNDVWMDPLSIPQPIITDGSADFKRADDIGIMINGTLVWYDIMQNDTGSIRFQPTESGTDW